MESWLKYAEKRNSERENVLETEEAYEENYPKQSCSVRDYWEKRVLLKDAVTGANTTEVRRSIYNPDNINYEKKSVQNIWLMKWSQNDKTFQ